MTCQQTDEATVLSRALRQLAISASLASPSVHSLCERFQGLDWGRPGSTGTKGVVSGTVLEGASNSCYWCAAWL